MDVRFLVTDYDHCAYSTSSEREDSLSQPIVNMAINGDYNGFYGCTHRAYNTVTLRNSLISWGKRLGYYQDAAEKNFPTYKITANFSAATALPLQAVSTLDDLLYPTCGTAYETVLKPYEENGTHRDPSFPCATSTTLLYNLQHKNYQLTQIAKHAEQNYPTATTITLDYVDDLRTLCHNAIEAETLPEWPKNVRLNIFHYNGDDIYPIYEHKEESFYDIAPCGPHCGHETIHTTPTPLQMHSLFSRDLPKLSLSPAESTTQARNP